MMNVLTRRARSEGYRARSIYKLDEINKKYNLIKKKVRILDLGSYPGSWLQYCFEREANVIGVDIREVKTLGNVQVLRLDIMNKDELKIIYDLGKFDLVLSDLSPKLTGIKDVDMQKSSLLDKKALEIACNVLRKKGSFICKVFQNSNEVEFERLVKNKFEQVKLFKPQASKKGSSEFYIIARDYKI